MVFSSTHTYTTVYIKGRSSSVSSGSALGATSGRCDFPGGGSAKCERSERSYCWRMSSRGVQDGGRGIYGGLGGGPLGSGYTRASPCGVDYGSTCSENFGGGFGISHGAPLFACGKKMTMQNLNDRLASYLDKVRCLEDENAWFECKIRKWYDGQGPLDGPKDYSCHYQQIEDLKKQLICATMDNSKLVLDIHNNQLTADDFRMKYEAELVFHQDMQADINSLRQVLDQLTLCRSDLEAQLESLQEELCCLKKNHEEEVKLLKNQATGNLNVEVNSDPGSDLQKLLDNLRRQYEAIIERNREEVERWYESMMEEINQQTINRNKEIEDHLSMNPICLFEDDNNQVVDLKCQLHTLEINLQSQFSLRDTLQCSLAETQCWYNNCLAEIQNQISCVELKLSELRKKTECQNQEYRELLDSKCLLEQEIETYHCLLEGEEHDP